LITPVPSVPTIGKKLNWKSFSGFSCAFTEMCKSIAPDNKYVAKFLKTVFMDKFKLIVGHKITVSH
jgi:hypothetical protein